jgi:hypothetical protein
VIADVSVEIPPPIRPLDINTIEERFSSAGNVYLISSAKSSIYKLILLSAHLAGS